MSLVVYVGTKLRNEPVHWDERSSGLIHADLKRDGSSSQRSRRSRGREAMQCSIAGCFQESYCNSGVRNLRAIVHFRSCRAVEFPRLRCPTPWPCVCACVACVRVVCFKLGETRRRNVEKNGKRETKTRKVS